MEHEIRKKKDNKAKKNIELNGKYNQKYIREKLKIIETRNLKMFTL